MTKYWKYLSAHVCVGLAVLLVAGCRIAPTPPPEGAVPVLVISVYDGDSVTAKTPDKRVLKLRLEDIDAPELKQPFGPASRDALTEKLGEGKVYALLGRKDKYRRRLATLYVDGESVNRWMVRNGWAWRYHLARCDIYWEEQQTARDEKLGLWERGPSVSKSLVT